MEFKDIVAACGGKDKLLEICGIDAPALDVWRRKNRVPPKHWARLVYATKGEISYTMLEEFNNRCN